MPRLNTPGTRQLSNVGIPTSTNLSLNILSGANLSGSATSAQLGSRYCGPSSGPLSVSVSSTWSFNSGNIIFVGTGLPYHSFYNSSAAYVPNAQSLNQTWLYRGGQTSGAGGFDATGPGRIGIWINGVSMYNSSAQTAGPNGTTNPYATYLTYNVAYGNGQLYNFITGGDLSGGYSNSANVYNYRDCSFILSYAWQTGIGHVSGIYGITGLAECSVIPYLKSGVTHPDGHSKILGFTADGYPMYGPYGYNNPTNPLSGVRRMISGYYMSATLSTRTALVNAHSPALNGANVLTSYPLGIFNQDYSFYASHITRRDLAYTITVVNSTYVFTASAGADSGVNPSLVVGVGDLITFTVSTGSNPFYIKTAPTTGSTNLVTVGITNNGTTNGTLTWDLTGVSPGTYYYQSSATSSMGGVIQVDAAINPDLDQHNGRYCVTPDFPSGTYAYFTSIDSLSRPAFPYTVGFTYSNSPASI